MLAVWHLRPAVQRRFPLHRGKARDWLRYLAWCTTNGRKDYAVLREIPEWDAELSRPVALPRLRGDRWEAAHSLATFLHGITLHRWSLSGMLKSSASRSLAAGAFWRGVRHRDHAPPIPTWQSESLRLIVGDDSGLAAKPEDADKYANGVTPSRPQPVELPSRLTCSPFPLPRPLTRWIEPAVQLARKRPTPGEEAHVISLIDTSPPEPSIDQGSFGVNLFGYARGELGIGEDIRQVALSLESQGIPVCIVDFAPGKEISQADETAGRLISETPRYGINIFCLTGIETVRYVCERGLSSLQGRYNIGLWPWELPDWPECCRHAYTCVDEIWGISEYTAHSHRFAAPRPVMPMGLPVELGPVGKETRCDFGLPEDAFLFAFAFDVSSGAERKNPQGLIQAFQRAFPRESGSAVGLVLKVSHADAKSKLWRRLCHHARRDPRIHLIKRGMRRPELLALFEACDCYVSLHRAEGFGRCLAEALLLDKQVIATGFSGNMHFCREPRVALVRHSPRAVRRGEYMWSEGQVWAEPDIAHAAELMRSVRSEPRPTGQCEPDFSPSVVGARYAARLREIWALHGPPPHPGKQDAAAPRSPSDSLPRSRSCSSA